MKRNRKTIPKPENEVKTVQKLKSNEKLPPQHFENQTLLTAHLKRQGREGGSLEIFEERREEQQHS